MKNFKVVSCKHIQKTGNYYTKLVCSDNVTSLAMFGNKVSQKTVYVFGTVNTPVGTVVQLDLSQWTIKQRPFTLPQGSTDKQGNDVSGKVIELDFLVKFNE